MPVLEYLNWRDLKSPSRPLSRILKYWCLKTDFAVMPIYFFNFYNLSNIRIKGIILCAYIQRVPLIVLVLKPIRFLLDVRPEEIEHFLAKTSARAFCTYRPEVTFLVWWWRHKGIEDYKLVQTGTAVYYDMLTFCQRYLVIKRIWDERQRTSIKILKIKPLGSRVSLQQGSQVFYVLLPFDILWF
jgi:hypothetical protein